MYEFQECKNKAGEVSKVQIMGILVKHSRESEQQVMRGRKKHYLCVKRLL